MKTNHLTAHRIGSLIIQFSIRVRFAAEHANGCSVRLFRGSEASCCEASRSYGRCGWWTFGPIRGCVTPVVADGVSAILST